MRTKRFLSLILAIAMMATISVSAQVTKVYLAEDFDYESAADFSAKFYSAGSADFGSASVITEQYEAMLTAKAEAGLAPVNYMYRTSNGGALGRHELVTNSLGHPAVNFIAEEKGAATQSGVWAIIPDEEWNYLDNKDETYIISFELDGKPVVHMKNDVASALSMTTYGYVFGKSPATAETVSYSSQRPFTYTAKTTVDSETGEGTATVTLATYQNLHSNAQVIPTYNINEGETYHVALGYEYWEGKTMAKQYQAMNGQLKGATTSGNNIKETNPVIWNFTWGWMHAAQTTMANLKMYTIKNTAGAFNVSTTLGDVIPATTKNIPVKFSQPVSGFTWDADAVTVTKNGEALTYGEDFTVAGLTQVVGEVGGEAYSTANVVFEDLDQSSEYVITFPETIANELGTTLGSYNTVTFTTPDPDIKINGFNIVKGWGTADEATADAFAADGSLQGAAIAVENTTEAAKNVAVIYAVYGANGQLSDVVYANDTVAALTETEIGAGMNLAAEGTVKAFVWDGISSLKPYAEATVKTIAAAE